MAGIEYVVVLMMENRSFDEYFGTFPGVAGFYDGSSSIAQPWPSQPGGVLYPWRMSTFTTNSLAAPGLGHDWTSNHIAINSDPATGVPDNRGFYTSSGQDANAMGCYLADDIPYHWALAQNFALCDHYFCSALAGTFPNRMFLVGGTITDPNQQVPASGVYQGNESNWNGVLGLETQYDGTDPVIYNFAPAGENPGADVPTLPWVTNLPKWTNYLADLWNKSGGQLPSYRVYDDWNWQFGWGTPPAPPAGGSGFYPGISDLNVFTCYSPYQLPSGPATLGTPNDPNYFAANVNSNGTPPDARPLFAQHVAPTPLEGNEPFLAQLTWIMPPYNYSEHPNYKSSDGALYIAEIVDALMESPFWESTVLIITYDESDTHFDHLPPTLSPDPGAQPRPLPYEPWVQDHSGGFASPAPIGGGMRVPAIIVSPWTYQRGVISDQLDHTSILQLMQTVSTVPCSTLPDVNSELGWRRANFADLYQVIDPDNYPVVPAAQITGLPTAAGSVAQWQTNANNRYLALQGNDPVAPAAQDAPPAPQTCALTLAPDPIDSAAAFAQNGAFPGAVTVLVSGFQAQEYIEPNAGVPPVQSAAGLALVPVQGGGTCRTRVPKVQVLSGAGPGEIVIGDCSQVSADPNGMANSEEPQLEYTFPLTFTEPEVTFAFAEGTTRQVNLQASFTVDATVTAQAQLTLTGGTLHLYPIDNLCDRLAETVALAEAAYVVAQGLSMLSPEVNQIMPPLTQALGAIRNLYSDVCPKAADNKPVAIGSEGGGG
jgi:phospholipase C